MTLSTADLRALLDAASPLPWSHDLAPHSSCIHIVSDGETGIVADMYADDAALAVEAVNALGPLLDRVEELEAENARLREEVDTLRELRRLEARPSWRSRIVSRLRGAV